MSFPLAVGFCRPGAGIRGCRAAPGRAFLIAPAPRIVVVFLITGREDSSESN